MHIMYLADLSYAIDKIIHVNIVPSVRHFLWVMTVRHFWVMTDSRATYSSTFVVTLREEYSLLCTEFLLMCDQFPHTLLCIG